MRASEGEQDDRSFQLERLTPTLRTALEEAHRLTGSRCALGRGSDGAVYLAFEMQGLIYIADPMDGCRGRHVNVEPDGVEWEPSLEQPRSQR
jgi:hypothetical protein